MTAGVSLLSLPRVSHSPERLCTSLENGQQIVTLLAQHDRLNPHGGAAYRECEKRDTVKAANIQGMGALTRAPDVTHLSRSFINAPSTWDKENEFGESILHVRRVLAVFRGHALRITRVLAVFRGLYCCG